MEQKIFEFIGRQAFEVFRLQELVAQLQAKLPQTDAPKTT